MWWRGEVTVSGRGGVGAVVGRWLQLHHRSWQRGGGDGRKVRTQTVGDVWGAAQGRHSEVLCPGGSGTVVEVVRGRGRVGAVVGEVAAAAFQQLAAWRRRRMEVRTQTVVDEEWSVSKGGSGPALRVLCPGGSGTVVMVMRGRGRVGAAVIARREEHGDGTADENAAWRR